MQLEAIAAAAEAGLKDHDRWQTARTLLARKLDGRRSTSRLPALLDYVLTRLIVSAGMIAGNFRLRPARPRPWSASWGLREATGRGRYRAWGILERRRQIRRRSVRSACGDP
ncbi:helix-turn-helix domain-containing protein [Nitrobacter hamburgensis]|uniref:helix-turn-helix domain-containing protein n=1 Tax=Nitrobacter hamburgensis TaxID=912 RepID=UPI0000556BDE|nr:helix-turn-helix domain-containing protein [Nitrobacter hamburgensis]